MRGVSPRRTEQLNLGHPARRGQGKKRPLAAALGLLWVDRQSPRRRAELFKFLQRVWGRPERHYDSFDATPYHIVRRYITDGLKHEQDDPQGLWRRFRKWQPRMPKKHRAVTYEPGPDGKPIPIAPGVSSKPFTISAKKDPLLYWALKVMHAALRWLNLDLPAPRSPRVDHGVVPRRAPRHSGGGARGAIPPLAPEEHSGAPPRWDDLPSDLPVGGRRLA